MAIMLVHVAKGTARAATSASGQASRGALVSRQRAYHEKVFPGLDWIGSFVGYLALVNECEFLYAHNCLSFWQLNLRIENMAGVGKWSRPCCWSLDLSIGFISECTFRRWTDVVAIFCICNPYSTWQKFSDTSNVPRYLSRIMQRSLLRGYVETNWNLGRRCSPSLKGRAQWTLAQSVLSQFKLNMRCWLKPTWLCMFEFHRKVIGNHDQWVQASCLWISVSYSHYHANSRVHD
jgi:hypothetical protein